MAGAGCVWPVVEMSCPACGSAAAGARSGTAPVGQTGAPGVLPADAPAALAAALGFLGLAPTEDLRGAPPGSLLAWALEHWSPARLRGASRAYAFAPSNIARSVS